jgi:hypothetical protein
MKTGFHTTRAFKLTWSVGIVICALMLGLSLYLLIEPIGDLVCGY